MRYSLLFCIGCLYGLILNSCNSNKAMNSKSSTAVYILELKSEKASLQLKDRYAEYKITNIGRISKSKYQYEATLTCKQEDCSGLHALLKSDDSVTKYFLKQSRLDVRKNSKGSKAHKTGPIGSKGGQ